MKMKKIVSILLLSALCGMFTACGSRQPADPGSTSIPADMYTSPIPSAGDTGDSAETGNSPGTGNTPDTGKPAGTGNTPDTGKPAGTGNTPDTENTAAETPDNMINAYRAALETLINDHIFPDGTDCGFDEYYDISENTFAVYDVDGDGQKELLIMYGNIYSAAMTGYVFGYDNESGNLKTELMAFPLLTFYDNGIVIGEWSHNQGLAGDFWPYNLYQYSPASDTYELVGMVDAWDKSYAETDSKNNPFPDDIDKSGTGFVYYIMTDGQYDTTTPVDAADYNAWLASYTANASQCPIEYQKLTQANISKLNEINISKPN